MRDRTRNLIETFAASLPMEDFSLSPAGTSVAFTRRVGEYAQIFTVPAARPAFPARVTAALSDCTEPQWSPDGTRLVFVKGTGLCAANADGTSPREIALHPAGNLNPRWSRGERIAFISRRRGWDHIWTVLPDDSGLIQVTRGEFDAADPAWSPDDASIAYCCTSSADLNTRGIYLIPANGGDARALTPSGCWNGAPSFSPDGKRLAYLSDRDGWFHVYLYDFETASARQLTQGEFEDGGPHFYHIDPLGGPLFSPDGERVACIRHRDGRFDVWTVEVGTGEARRISPGDGEYRLVGWLPDSRRMAVTFDNPASTCDLWVIGMDTEPIQLTDSSVAGLDTGALTMPEWITYKARDGLTIPAALFRTKAEGRRPAVLFLHGGPNFEFGQYYYPLPQILAQEGYVVLAPNYRGSTGYGTAFRQANFREWGNADALDVVDGAEWLKTRDYIDPDHVAVVGPSYGGYLTLCALTLAPHLFCAGVDMYGDSEIAESYRHGDREARLDVQRHMGTPEENPEGYRRGSPVYLAERIQAPVLILQGRQDMLVVPLMSERLIEQLKIENKVYEAHFYDDESHGFSKPHNKQDAWRRIVEFLNRHCGL